jgi:TetR/AcrR family fatty acid metabolism transcriptional regulator
MSPRAPEATRRRILDAAMDVFAGKGYHDAAVDDIVRASATSKGAVYFHFPSKEQLFLALIDALAARLLRAVDRAIADVDDSIGRADAAIGTALDTFARHRSLAKILLVDAVGCGPAVDRKLLEVHGRIGDYIAQHLDGAVAAGAIPPLDTRLAALVWLGALHEVITRWLYTGEPDLAAARPHLRTMLLRSIGATAGTED